MKTIVIGCGATIEKGGDIRDTPPWYPFAFHRHSNCITVDNDAACSPSILMDFVTVDVKMINTQLSYQKFDLIVLENLPIDIYYTPEQFIRLIMNCHSILSEIGQVFIPRAMDPALLKKYFTHRGFKLVLEHRDMSVIYPLISAFVGSLADDYITFAQNMNKKMLRSCYRMKGFPYLLFRPIIYYSI